MSATTTQTNGVTTTHGVGAAATALLVTSGSGIGTITITDGGSGYPTEPIVYFNTPTSGIGTAVGRALVSTANTVSQILISDAGIGYTSATGIVTVAPPPILTGSGAYQFNEIVTGSISGAKGRVKSWDKDTNILKLGSTNGTFVSGDVAIGSTSESKYTVDYIETAEFADKYAQNDNIESEADAILDFSESNPFGTY